MAKPLIYIAYGSMDELNALKAAGVIDAPGQSWAFIVNPTVEHVAKSAEYPLGVKLTGGTVIYGTGAQPSAESTWLWSNGEAVSWSASDNGSIQLSE